MSILIQRRDVHRTTTPHTQEVEQRRGEALAGITEKT